MADKTNVDINDFIGKDITDDTLQNLLSGGHISFPDKPVTGPSAVSKGSSDSCEDKKASGTDGINLDKNKDEHLKGMIDSVKENEALVKTLEDMRDDMLAGMNISPATDTIGDAAGMLNGDGNNNITDETFYKAEAIQDTFAYVSLGHIPQLVPLVGDTRILNDIRNCNEVTKAAFDGLKFAEDGASPEAVAAAMNKTTADNIAETEESFKKELAKMALYLINKLFWDFIWARMWTAIFNMVEKLVCKPIDMIIWIARFMFWVLIAFKRGKEVWYRYGIMHKLVNKLKMIFLCKIPHGVWRDYSPEPNIMIWYDQKMQPLVGICSDSGIAYFEDCVSITPDPKPKDNSSQSQNEDNDDIKENKGAINNAFDKFEEDENLKEESEADKCDSYFEFMGSYQNVPDEGNGITPDCVEAAKTVLQAVYNDARFNNGADIDNNDTLD